MAEWPRVRLADVADIQAGFAFKSADYCEPSEGVRLLRGDNVIQRGLRWEGAKYFPRQAASQYCAYLLREHDVVVAMDRPWIEAGLKVASIRQNDLPALLVQRVARLRTLTPELHQEFVTWVMYAREFTDHVLAVQTGTAVPHISSRQIGDYAFCLPPLPVQRRITAVLGALDDLIETNQKLASLTEQFAIALVRTNPDTVPLSDVTVTAAGSTRPHGVVDHYSLPAFDAGRVPKREGAASIRSNKIAIERPSVLVSRLNPHIPRVWMAYPDSQAMAVASTEFVVLSGEQTEYVWAACASSTFIEAMQALVTGTTGSHQRVDKGELARLPIADPHAADSRTAEAVKRLVREANGSRSAAVTLRRTRDELLPLLMSGRVSPGEVDLGV